MRCEQHLALEAILVGLRRAGAIDRRTVQTIAEVLHETAAKARPHCSESAEGLERLAAAIAEGPGRTCLVTVAA